MRCIDEMHLLRPFYGSRRIRDWLVAENHDINRKRVQRLMRLMGIMALYPKKGTSRPGKGHKIYFYFLKGLFIDRPNQVFCTDITYIPMTKGFVYLVAIMDWRSLKYEDMYLKAYDLVNEARASIRKYIGFYNAERKYQALEKTPTRLVLE